MSNWMRLRKNGWSNSKRIFCVSVSRSSSTQNASAEPDDEDMSVMYGEIDQKPLSKDALEAQLRSITERSEQILYVLKHVPEDHEQAVELRAELAIYRDQAAEIKRTLDPDPEATERRRQFEAGLKAQAAEMAARHAPT